MSQTTTEITVFSTLIKIRDALRFMLSQGINHNDLRLSYRGPCHDDDGPMSYYMKTVAETLANAWNSGSALEFDAMHGVTLTLWCDYAVIGDDATLMLFKMKL